MISEADIPKKLAVLAGIATAGYAVALHIRYQTPTYLFQTYPSDWREEYGREGLLLRDPTVAWAFANSGARSWSESAREDTEGVMARAAAHGLRHGVTISLRPGGSLSIGNFGRADRDFTAGEVEAMDRIMTELHEATASAGPLPAETREGLRRLSVAFTQP